MLGTLSHLYRVAHSVVRERRKDKERSPHWASVRHAYLLLYPKCAACSSDKRPQVHHIEPFHLKPDLELVSTNLITLCMGAHECHLRLGHGDDFRAYNPLIIQHANALRLASAKRADVELLAIRHRLYEDTAA